MTRTTTTSRRRVSRLMGWYAWLVALAVAAAVFSTSTGAQQFTQDANQNFDIRTDTNAGSVAYRQRLAVPQALAGVAERAGLRAAGLARLRVDFSAIDVIESPQLGTVEVVSVKPGSGFLRGPSTDRVGAMRAFLSTYADAYGLSAEQIGSLELVADYVNPAGNMAWVEFEQRINGLPVFQGLVRGGFTANGELVRTTGPLASGLETNTLSQTPALTAAQAVAAAASNVGWNVTADALAQKGVDDRGRVTFARGPMADDAKAWLLYFPLAPGVARLAWATEIWGHSNAFLILQDAEDGTVFFRKDLTNHESQTPQRSPANISARPPPAGLPSRGEWSRALRPGGETWTYTFSVSDEGGIAPLSFGSVVGQNNGRASSRAVGGGNQTDYPSTSENAAERSHSPVATHGVENVAPSEREARSGSESFSLQLPQSLDRTSGVALRVVATPWAPPPRTEPGVTASELSLAQDITPLATLDIIAERAYLRTASGGGGTEVDQPTAGQTVYLHLDLQLAGTGGAVSMSNRAVLDGTTFCGGSFSAAPPSSFVSWCNGGWVATPGSHTLRWDLDYTNSVIETNENNNSASKIFAPSGVDIVAQRSYMRTASGGGGIEVDPAVGQTVYFHLDWQLAGSSSLVFMSQRAVLDGTTVCSFTASATPPSSWVSWCGEWVATAGSHTLRWDLDYNNVVAETNESNNSASKTFTPFASLDIAAQRSYMRTIPGGGGTEVDPPAVGQTVYFHLDWELAGSGSSVSVSRRAVLDGTTFCDSTLSAAPPSSWVSWCSSGWVATVGSHTLRWDLDYAASVAETNENNNSVSKPFTLSTTSGTQSATYVVYTDDSPAPLSPTTALPGAGTQAAYISRTTRTLIGNEAPNTFNNLGWMTDGTNVTAGNNVEAGLDRVVPDGVDAPVTGVNRVFNFTYNPQTDSPLTAAYQNGEVTDMFYWTNVYHDRLYLLGFTEAARNFQNDNFGRGGVGADRVSAEAQDSSGTNNANFSTPSDGTRGRMQMYLWGTASPDRSSGLDHDVLLHELTHGTSNRLHNNASGLTTIMSKGMGEGWSDFYARALLSSASEDPSGIYVSGGWLASLLYADSYYYGTRRFPYVVKSTVGANGKPHNPLTFKDIDSEQINLSDGAYSPARVGPAFEVHNAGEVWAMALLEVRARFITRLGFATGNQRILQFVTDGMKLDPTNPTFLQGRDSIIAAANGGGGTAADIADIWAGFSARGMGVSAQVLNASTGTVVEAFDSSAPTVVTVAATSLTATGATLNGTVNPNGSSTTARFDYGLTTSYGSQAIASPEPGSGTSAVAISAAITGLSCSRLYHFRAVGTNASTTTGADLTFTTATCPSSPTVSTISPTSGLVSGGTSVTITGTGFATGATVALGGASATIVTVSATTITATTGAHAPGLVTVVVTNSDGQTGTLLNGFNYSAPFTDPTLSAGVSVIKVIYITELRTRIDAVRVRRGLEAYLWTDPDLAAGVTAIKAAHITDLRTALLQVYAAPPVITPPTFTDPVLTAGVTVAKVAHIAELRAALIAIE